MKYVGRTGLKWGAALGLGLISAAAFAAGQPQPAPVAAPQAVPAPTATATPPAAVPVASPTASATDSAVPVIAPQLPLDEPVMTWTVADAEQLLAVIRGLDAEGLFPADYEPKALAAEIAAGPGPALDVQASKAFAWLAEDLRDGRTRMTRGCSGSRSIPIRTNPTHS
jgi:hypothetical protein